MKGESVEGVVFLCLLLYFLSLKPLFFSPRYDSLFLIYEPLNPKCDSFHRITEEL